MSAAAELKASILLESAEDWHAEGNIYLEQARGHFTRALAAKGRGDRESYHYHLYYTREYLRQHDGFHAAAFRETEKLEKLLERAK